MAFPATGDLLRFLRAASAHRVPFKATAGLHHPLRAEYRLTYEPDSPSRHHVRVSQPLPGGCLSAAAWMRPKRRRFWRRNLPSPSSSTGAESAGGATGSAGCPARRPEGRDRLVRLLLLHRAHRRAPGLEPAPAEHTAGVNQTHDPGLTSWVASAQGHPDFPIQNLPFGVFRRSRTSDPVR